jgi:AcrR family transcriptional regulator
VSKLDHQAIVTCAVKLGDEAGLGAVGLRGVAARLGVTPMALYRHVENKEALLDAIAEWLYGEFKLPRATDGWWDALALMAHSTRRVVLAHPWAVPLLGRPLAGANARAFFDALVDALGRAGFSARDVTELHEQLSGMVLALIVAELQGRPNRAAFERGLDMVRAGLEARAR